LVAQYGHGLALGRKKLTHYSNNRSLPVALKLQDTFFRGELGSHKVDSYFLAGA
jgi:hypothetical protein